MLITEGRAAARAKGGLQVSNDDMCTRGRVVSSDGDVSACFMASLSESPDLFAFYQRKVAPRHLDEGGRYGAHDQCKEERVALFSEAAEVFHKGWSVYARREGVYKVEE